MGRHTLQLAEDFHLEYGQSISGLEIAYHTWGSLNDEQDNVLIIVHALTASSDVSDWWSGLFGVGKPFDPDKYFIICANNLGSPYGTTSAATINPETSKTYGFDFPFTTIRDTARLHIRLLEDLGIERVSCIIGPSCGGNIAQEMALLLGHKLDKLGLICCSGQESPWVIAIHEVQKMALMADPDFEAGLGSPKGLAAARAVAMPFYRTSTSFKVRQSEEDDSKVNEFKASSYITYQGQKFVNRFNPYAYYHLLFTLDSHNMGRGRESIEKALSLISAKTLCISFSSDILVPAEEQAFLAEHIPDSDYVNIETIYGHDAFLIEVEKVGNQLLQFLS